MKSYSTTIAFFYWIISLIIKARALLAIAVGAEVAMVTVKFVASLTKFEDISIFLLTCPNPSIHLRLNCLKAGFKSS